MKDAELLVLKVLKSKDAKQKYIMYHLRTHWADIIGHTAANHSQPPTGWKMGYCTCIRIRQPPNWMTRDPLFPRWTPTGAVRCAACR